MAIDLAELMKEEDEPKRSVTRIVVEYHLPDTQLRREEEEYERQAMEAVADAIEQANLPVCTVKVMDKTDCNWLYECGMEVSSPAAKGKLLIFQDGSWVDESILPGKPDPEGGDWLIRPSWTHHGEGGDLQSLARYLLRD